MTVLRGVGLVGAAISVAFLAISCGRVNQRPDGAAANPDVGVAGGGSSGTAGTDGGAGLAVAGAGAGGDAAGEHPAFTCDSSARIEGYDNGFEICNGDAMQLHRTHVSACQSELPRANLPAPSSFDQCGSDEECTERAYGHCESGHGPGDGIARACEYGCLVDSDCDSGSICLCGTYVGYCTSAECSTDANCGAGSLCAAYWTTCHRHVGFACQNAADECLDDADCGTDRLCERAADGIRRCIARDSMACSSP